MHKIIYLFVLFLTTVFSQTFQDMYNRTVTINQNEKIVCLGPGSLRLLTYMQSQDALAGIEKLELLFDYKAPYRAALDQKFLKTLPIVGQGGPGKMPNLETLISLKPDIIFTSFLSKEQVELIQQKTKIPVVALSYGATYGGSKDQSKLSSIKNSLKLIGNILDKNNRAHELISFMDQEEQSLAQLLLDKNSLYIGGIGYKGAQGINSTESHYPPFELLHIKNEILKDHIGHGFINSETLLSYNPKIIFLDQLGKSIILEELKNQDAIYKNIDAFKNEKIYWLKPYNFYNTNIENVYFNSWLIASYLGVNVNINEQMQRIYSLFLGQEATLQLQHNMKF